MLHSTPAVEIDYNVKSVAKAYTNMYLANGHLMDPHEHHMAHHEDNFVEAIDEEWAQARRKAGLSSNACDYSHRWESSSTVAVVSPYLLLYTGLLLGPLATFITSLLIIPGALLLRHKVTALAIAGIVWCILHALSFNVMSQGEVSDLAPLRAITNFALGLSVFMLIKVWSASPIRHTRQTLINTVVLSFVMVGLYWQLLGTSWLYWLGSY